MKSILLSLILFSISFSGCPEVQDLVDQTKSSISSATGSSSTNSPRISSKNYKNTLDSLKISSPELAIEVENGKLQDGITVIFNNGTRISPNSVFKPKNFTHGWINPTDGFTNLFKESKGEKVTIKRKRTNSAGKTEEQEFYGILEFAKVYE